MTHPDPAAWREGSITLERAADGTLSGQITLHDARWHIRGWRAGGDKLHILFEGQPVVDPETLKLMEALR